MKRLLGLLLIVRALAPILAVVTIIWAYGQIAGVVREVIQGPISTLKNDIDDIGQTIDSAWRQFDQAGSTVSGNIRMLAAHLKAFSLPAFTPGQLSGLLSGLAGPMNDLFRPIERIFHPFGEMLDSISLLGSSLYIIPQSFNNAIDQGRLILDRLRSMFERWSGLLIVAVILVLGLVAIYNIAQIVDDLARGWHLLRG
jgi:hypothetical protein